MGRVPGKAASVLVEPGVMACRCSLNLLLLGLYRGFIPEARVTKSLAIGDGFHL